MIMVHTEFESLGFAPGVVRGARSFGVDPEGRLTGIVFRQAIWYPGVNAAECLRGTDNDPYAIRSWYGITYVAPGQMMVATTAHLLPAPTAPHVFETCKCGFYGYYDGSNDYQNRVNTRVSGVVEGWGETLIGSRGFRCSKARIVALTLHDSAVANQIRDHYWDVPLFGSFEDMVAEFPPGEVAA